MIFISVYQIPCRKTIIFGVEKVQFPAALYAELAVYQQAAQDAYLLSEHETVIRLSEEALEKFGESDDTLVFRKWLGISYFETGDLAEAEINLTAMIDSGETMPELNYLRGITAEQLEQSPQTD